MVRRSPSERYMRYLLMCPEGYSNQQIKELMVQLDLLYVSGSYIAKLRDQCTPKFELKLKDVARHRATREHLLKLEILDMFLLDDRSKKNLEQTHHILEHPRQKEMVEALLNNNASHKHIALFLRMSGGVFSDFKEEAVARYEKLFWDRTLVDSREMMELCEMRHLQVPTGLTTEEKEQFIKIGNRNKYRDPRYISASLPQNKVTALVTQIRMGFPVKVEDLKEIYAAIHQTALAAALETAARNMPMMGAEMQSLLNAAKLAKEMSETVEEAEESMQKKLNAIAIKHSEGPVKTMMELTGGNHSTDLMAPQEARGSLGEGGEEDE